MYASGRALLLLSGNKPIVQLAWECGSKIGIVERGRWDCSEEEEDGMDRYAGGGGWEE